MADVVAEGGADVILALRKTQVNNFCCHRKNPDTWQTRVTLACKVRDHHPKKNEAVAVHI